MIEPHLKMNIDRDDYKYIDYMFEECYVTVEDGHEVVTLRPPPCEVEYGVLMGLQFLTLNGSYYSVDDWEYIKVKGKKL